MENYHTTLSVGSAVVVFLMATIVLPLVRYVVSIKDKQIDELNKKLDEFREIKKDEQERAAAIHRQLFEKCQSLELSTTKLGGEVELANGVHTRLDKLADKLDFVGGELGSMQTVLNMLLKGRLTAGNESTFPVFKADKDSSKS